MKSIPNIGGQAVIEGVMLRSPHYCAIAVRKDGIIKTKLETVAPLRYAQVPLVRGVIGLYDMLVLGTKALLWSAAQAEGDHEKLTKRDVVMLLVPSALLAIIFFILLPLFAASALTSSHGLAFNIIDGIMRLGIFVGYIGIISRMEDIKTLFRYHGAEHKVVNCYELHKKLTLSEAKHSSSIHPRCGTTFVVLILLLSILVFSTVTIDHWGGKLALRFMVLPLLAGFSYELIRLAAKLKNTLFSIIIIPGLWFQRLTVREPTNDELEVALAALRMLIEQEDVHAQAA